MIYGSIRVHMGPYGPIWVARGEKSHVKEVKIIISDRDFFLGLCQGDVHHARNNRHKHCPRDRAACLETSVHFEA